MWKKIKLLVSW